MTENIYLKYNNNIRKLVTEHSHYLSATLHNTISCSKLLKVGRATSTSTKSSSLFPATLHLIIKALSVPLFDFLKP